MPQWEYRELIDPTTMEMTAAGNDRWECFAVAALHPRERGLLYTFKRERQEAAAAEPPLAALRRLVVEARDEADRLGDEAQSAISSNYHEGARGAYQHIIREIDRLMAEGAQP
jgi:hypothetical protein